MKYLPILLILSACILQSQDVREGWEVEGMWFRIQYKKSTVDSLYKVKKDTTVILKLEDCLNIEEKSNPVRVGIYRKDSLLVIMDAFWDGEELRMTFQDVPFNQEYIESLRF